MEEKNKRYKSKGKKEDKKNKKAKKKKSKFWKIVRRILLVLILIGLVIAGIAIGKVYTMCKEAKLDMAEVAIKHENSVVKDINGEIIATLSGDENRDSIKFSDMSSYIPKAFVAIEDERFYEHSGVDVKRTVGATGKWILSKVGIGSASYGGSKITQQMVKNLTEEKDRSWERKVKEMARAYYIEQELSKDQILELYLNLIFLGDRAYGVEVASIYYFNKSASELSLAESAFLAGINNSPNSYNPFEDETEEDKTETMDLIKRRTKTVLGKMLELEETNPGKYITKEEYDTAIAEVDAGLKFVEGQIVENVYSYHTDAAVNEVIDELMKKNDWTREYAKLYVTSSGITIYTTQNTAIQNIMEEEFAQDKYIITATKDGVTYESEAAMTIIDHKTGYVVATVGGLGPKTSFGLNRSTQSPRQTGSSMKPIAVVAPGIEKGIITAATSFDDVPTYIGSSRVKNSTGYRGLITTRYAIETSQNIPMAQAILKIGPQNSIEFLKNMGITTLDEQKDNYYGLSLGGLTNGVTTLEMAGAYACIANDGVYIEPTFFTKVTDKYGNTVLETTQDIRTVMSKAAAYVVKEILTQPAKSGTATYCSISGMSVAAKTGTTDDNFDRWLCGFTPYYSAATWFGYDYNVEVRWSGTNPAGLLWSRVMKPTHEGLASKYFSSTRPSGVTTASVCKNSGLLATEFCEKDPRGSQVYTEYFVSGTVPKEKCTCHVSVDICTDTGLLANEFCPNKETKVFITRPNAETDTAWKSAKDAEYTLTIKDTCAEHKAPPVEEPIKPEENKPEEGQKPEENKPGQNEIGGNQVGGNEIGGNQVPGNETGGNQTPGNETGGNQTVENEVVNKVPENTTIATP